MQSERAEVLRLYDLHERRGAAFPNHDRIETANTVRMVSGPARRGTVIYSNLDASTAKDAISAELAYFADLGMPFEWKLFAHDQPENLRDFLAAEGFEIGETESVACLDLGNFDPPPTPGIDFLRVSSDAADSLASGTAEFSAFEDLNRRLWPDAGESPWIEELRQTLQTDPDRMSLYLACVDRIPVAAGRIDFPQNSPFASLWGGATLEAYRNRGVYSALLGVRAREAKARGYRFLTTDAGPMSLPIVLRRGFQVLTETWPCEAPTASKAAK